MRVKVINDGIYDHKGAVEIGRVLTVQKIPQGWTGKVTELDGEVDEDTPEGTSGTDGGGFKVEEKPRGWFVITKDGEEITKNLRDTDIEGFDDLSEEKQAEFVEANKKD